MEKNKCSKCYHKKVCIDGANYRFAEKCKNYVPEDFGKSVFLSREEAEGALEEREKNG